MTERVDRGQESPEASRSMELESDPPQVFKGLSPVTESLFGLIAGSDLDEDLYYQHLEKKHL